MLTDVGLWVCLEAGDTHILWSHNLNVEHYILVKTLYCSVLDFCKITYVCIAHISIVVHICLVLHVRIVVMLV